MNSKNIHITGNSPNRCLHFACLAIVFVLFIITVFPVVYAETENFVETTLEENLLKKITVSDFVFRGGAINESTELGYFKGVNFQNGDWFLAVVDLSENKFELVTTIPLQPNSLLLIDESTNKIYLFSSADGIMDVLDGDSNEITDFVELGNLASGISSIKLNESTQRMYVFTGTWPSGTHFDVYDLETATKINSFPIEFRQGMGVGGFEIHDEKNHIYLLKHFPNQILEINEDGQIIDTIELDSLVQVIKGFGIDKAENKIYIFADDTRIVTLDIDSKDKEVIDLGKLDPSRGFRNYLTVNPYSDQLLFGNTDYLFVLDLNNKKDKPHRIEVRDAVFRTFVDEANGRIYYPYGNELFIFSIDDSINQAPQNIETSFFKKTQTELEQTDKSITKPIPFTKSGLKVGQWVKYQIAKIDVQSDNRMFSAEGLEQAILEMFIPSDKNGNKIYDMQWFKLVIEDVTSSQYKMGNYVGLSNGEEKYLESQWNNLELGDFPPFVIPTNLKEGNKITFGDMEFEIEESKLNIDGKVLDVFVITSEERTVGDMAQSTFSVETIYHKYTGMLLLLTVDAQARGSGQSFDMNFGLQAFEVSDHFLEKPSLSIGGGGCLIATAAYGTELAPQVQFLREIRDNTVMSTVSGTSFMTGFNQLYYSFSPTIADWERENPIFQEAVRAFITPMISTLSIMTLAEGSSELQVLGLGISVIALNLGMYVVVPAIILYKIRKIV